MIFQYKYIDIVTLFTDLALAIEAFIFAFILLALLLKKEDRKDLPTLMWILTFISVGLFALFGAISHGSNLQAVGDALWPPTMIFGGIAFIFLVAGLIIYQKEKKYLLLLVIPIILVIGYLIMGFIINWPFLLWVFLLLICSIIIYIFAFRAKREGKIAGKYIIIGLTIVIIAGVVQAIGAIIGIEIIFGPSNEFRFEPHNDIFHIIAMVGMYYFFLGFKKYLVSERK